MTYRGLLARAHEEQLKSIETTLLQFPGSDNGQTAVVRALVTTSKGQFSGLGDANPGNVNAMIAPHLIRMAETRAKARALRDAVNIGVVCLEELGAEFEGESLFEGTIVPVSNEPPVQEDGGGNGGKIADTRKPDLATESRTNGSKPESITESQRRYLFRLLAGKSILGEAAKDWLLKTLEVRAIKDATKAQASALIERLLREGRGNGDGNHAHPA